MIIDTDDPLSDILRAVRFDGAVFHSVTGSGRWSLRTPPARHLVREAVPAAAHTISCHIVTSGRCFGGLAGGTLVELQAGDVIVFPHGDGHVLASEATLHPGECTESASLEDRSGTLTLGSGENVTASLLSGYLGWDVRPANPLFSTLPSQIHVRGMSSEWEGRSTRLLMNEVRLGRPGAVGALTRLAELLFIEVIRRYLEEMPARQAGLLSGLRDDMVGRALALLHEKPAYPWTLGALGQQVAASRSTVAERFNELVGQPPMQYLTQWRMQLAANLLQQGQLKIAAVGSEVGYDSEAAFSRAFKRATGLAPGAWRQARARKPGRPRSASSAERRIA